MTLSKYLKETREKQERSLRWVERKSREMFPDDPDCHVSNGYLYQIENSDDYLVSPPKLKTLAKIYKIDYSYLLELAGYLKKDTPEQDELTRKINMLSPEQQKAVMQMIDSFINT